MREALRKLSLLAFVVATGDLSSANATDVAPLRVIKDQDPNFNTLWVDLVNDEILVGKFVKRAVAFAALPVGAIEKLQDTCFEAAHETSTEGVLRIRDSLLQKFCLRCHRSSPEIRCEMNFSVATSMEKYSAKTKCDDYDGAVRSVPLYPSSEQPNLRSHRPNATS